MRFAPRRFWRWQLSAGVIAPSALLLALAAVAAVMFVVWSTNRIDAQTLERETALVARGIERKLAEIPNAQESVAIWDDAIVNARQNFDKEWLDNNLGVWMHDFYGFDAVAVLSDREEYIYTMSHGLSPAPGGLASLRSAIGPLVEEMRQQMAAGALAAYENGGSYPHVLDVRIVGGRPAAIGVMPITSQTGEIEQQPGSEYLHVVLDYLDEQFAATIHDTYQIEDVAFTQAPSQAAGRSSYAIFDLGGRLATFFEWRPARPGLEMLQQTLPVIGLAFLLAAVLVAFLIRRLWSSSAKLETERVEARHQAMHDPLTGLPNRRHFESQLARDMSHPRPTVPTALLMLDLDRFKHVNDTFGHEAGDRLICAVGQRLRELVGPADVVARLGGDEFAVIHPCREADISASDLADRIVDAMAKPFDVNGSEAFVGTSIGVAIADRSDNEPRELVRKADISLYEAKARGRGRAQLYEPSMGAQLQDQHQLEVELREALRRDDQLGAAFQPLVSPDGDIIGVEVLARWSHPTLGQVSPAHFIPIAESSGLIDPLGEFVLRRACTFGARWPGRRVAVNISPVQLRNPRFPERVFDLLIETAMRPSDLELEITEGILLDPDGPALDALTVLRKAGIRIALDDFGTGYSSLNYLKRYPVDCIKIDRSFVAQLAPGTSSVAIVEAIVTLAHALDIEVTAEGVETHEQLILLKTMGCNQFQGFLLAPPAEVDVVEAKLHRIAERARRETQAA